MTTMVFSYTEPIKFGWDRLKKYWKLFAFVMGISLIMSVVGNVISGVLESQTFILFLIQLIVITPVNMVIQLASVFATLWIVDDKGGGVKGAMEEFKEFITPRKVVYFFLSSMLMGLAVMVGLLLVIVPGIILAVMFSMYSYAFVDGVYGVRAPLKRSRELTQGIKMRLFIFGLVLMVFNLLGLLALIVGVFVTAPVSMIAYAYVYRVLTGNAPQGELESVRAVKPSMMSEASPEPQPVESRTVSGMGMPRPSGDL